MTICSEMERIAVRSHGPSLSARYTYVCGRTRKYNPRRDQYHLGNAGACIVRASVDLMDANTEIRKAGISFRQRIYTRAAQLNYIRASMSTTFICTKKKKKK